jgi:hypothetical protein
MTPIKHLTLPITIFGLLFIFACSENKSEDVMTEDAIVEEPVNEEVVDNFDYEMSQLNATKYEKIERCDYFKYDEVKGTYINDDPLPTASFEEAKALLDTLSAVDGSYLGFEPPNKKSVQFSWYEDGVLEVDIMEVVTSGAFAKKVTIEEAYEIIDIVINGKDYSGIEGLAYWAY